MIRITDTQLTELIARAENWPEERITLYLGRQTTPSELPYDARGKWTALRAGYRPTWPSFPKMTVWIDAAGRLHAEIL